MKKYPDLCAFKYCSLDRRSPQGSTDSLGAGPVICRGRSRLARSNDLHRSKAGPIAKRPALYGKRNGAQSLEQVTLTMMAFNVAEGAHNRFVLAGSEWKYPRKIRPLCPGTSANRRYDLILIRAALSRWGQNVRPMRASSVWLASACAHTEQSK